MNGGQKFEQLQQYLAMCNEASNLAILSDFMGDPEKKQELQARAAAGFAEAKAMRVRMMRDGFTEEDFIPWRD